MNQLIQSGMIWRKAGFEILRCAQNDKKIRPPVFLYSSATGKKFIEIFLVFDPDYYLIV
jgi:hypothetical protein